MGLERWFKFRQGDPEQVKPFLDHLEELRWTLVKMGITLVVGMGASFAFRNDLVRIVQRPLHQLDPQLVGRLQVLGVTDPLTIAIQLAFYAGIVLTFPLLLFFLAQFVLPALNRQEKKYVLPGITFGFALFLSGVSFCYFFVLPQTLGFFFGFARSLEWTPTWTVRDYFSFVTQITLAFGLAFELPVAVLLLNYLGIVSFAFLNRTRPFAIVLILCLAVVIAPTPDVITFLSLGVPMCLLYEICIWLAWIVERRRNRPPRIETR
ncbi:MAG: sec-independent protein translocase protein TatC [Chthoniobacter sp.]|jgi:sec-independent protein translocase protein TatC|nr:sec-independent protein translocase protein TatC [Chthoniobacter sp.]